MLLFIRSLFEWVNARPTAVAIRESLNGYPVLLSLHVVSMCLFAGLVVMMDLRLVGAGYVRMRISQVQKRLFPWQMVGLVFSSLTGTLLFYAEPMRYYGKVFFWTKAVLMALAGLNAMIFHRFTYQSVAAWDSDRKAPFRVRLAGGLSLALWAGVVIFGRITAYPWLTFE